MLWEFAQRACFLVMLIFVISSMIAMGLDHTLNEICGALRNLRLVTSMLLVNFILMPLGSLIIIIVLQLDEPIAAGLVLLGAAAGAPFLPKLTELAKGDLPFAIGAMVLLSVTTIGYLPIVLPLLLPGVMNDPLTLTEELFVLILLPLAIGLGLNARYDSIAAHIKPVLDYISNASLIISVSSLSALNIDKVLQLFGTRGILGGIALVILGLSAGWLLGGPCEDTRRALALSTGQRNIAAAIAGSQSFSDITVEITVIVVGIFGLLLVMPLCLSWRRR